VGYRINRCFRGAVNHYYYYSGRNYELVGASVKSRISTEKAASFSSQPFVFACAALGAIWGRFSLKKTPKKLLNLATHVRYRTLTRDFLSGVYYIAFVLRAS
jgi:hypothetical protein